MAIFGYEPVMEKYVGKNYAELKVAERELGKIVDIINKKYKPLKDRVGTSEAITLTAHELNGSDHVKLIEKMFTKFFGIREFSLSFSVTADPNAMTMCRSFMFLDNNYQETSDGRRSNKNMFVGVIVHTGLVTYANMDEEELMAVILHEVGHNFYNSVFHTLSSVQINLRNIMTGRVIQSMADALISLGIYDIIGLGEINMKVRSMMVNFFSERFPKIERFFSNVNDVVHNVLSFFTLGVVNIEALEKYITYFPVTSYLFRYNVEKFADSFAVDHGYGPALGRGLDKLRKQENTSVSATLDNIPGVNWMVDLLRVQMEFINDTIGPYPSNQNRIRTILDRLKRSAKDPSIDPRVKAELQKHIDEYEDYYNNTYLDFNQNKNKKRVFSWTYRVIVEKMFAGKMDIRELIHAIDPKKYH